MTAVRFFKIILTTTLAAEKLKLPKKFTRKHGDGVSNPVFLKTPDGTEWKMYWTKHDGGEIWFQKGWKEFVRYYSLDHGHLLFFEYDQGASHFDVHIFDNSAVEIDYPSRGTDHEGKDNLVEISDDSVEILDEQFSCQNTTRVKPTVSFPQPSKKMKSSITTNVKRSPNKASFVKHEFDEDEEKGIFNTECSKREELTSTTLNKASTFRLVMKQSFINGDYVEIPQHFAEKYLKKTRVVVILEVLDGRTWPVIYSSPRIIAGWQKFASENNLNVGDVCVFEPITKIHQGIAFKVSIFQGTEEPSCPISQGGSSSQRSSIVKSRFKSKILTIRAFKRASKFRSENPSFLVTLSTKSKTNITRHAHVPKDFVRKHFVNMNQKVLMIHFRKKLWPVKFSLYECSNSLGKLSTGWASFVRENELQRGDVCVFELVNKEDVTLDAHVFRGEQVM